MTAAHLTLVGRWEECAAETCELKFHFPDMTPEQVLALPRPAVEMLLEALDPPILCDDGVKEWRDAACQLHRDYDLPAVVSPDGLKKWFQHGDFHRENGLPAIIAANGACTWYENDLPHRVDGPAIVIPGQHEAWFLNGKRHRDGDEAALIEADGTREWYQHGLPHREGGKPACVSGDGKRDWYWHGKLVTRAEMTVYRIGAYMTRLRDRFAAPTS